MFALFVWCRTCSIIIRNKQHILSHVRTINQITVNSEYCIHSCKHTSACRCVTLQNYCAAAEKDKKDQKHFLVARRIGFHNWKNWNCYSFLLLSKPTLSWQWIYSNLKLHFKIKFNIFIPFIVKTYITLTVNLFKFEIAF